MILTALRSNGVLTLGIDFSAFSSSFLRGLQARILVVSSPDFLVIGWGGSLVDRAKIFFPALECRLQVLVCRFGSVRYRIAPNFRGSKIS